MGRTPHKRSAQIEFGDRVRRRRERLGLSQLDLAERSGVHFTYISSVERGHRNVTLMTILRLARALDVNPARLVDGLVWAEDHS